MWVAIAMAALLASGCASILPVPPPVEPARRPAPRFSSDEAHPPDPHADAQRALLVTRLDGLREGPPRVCDLAADLDLVYTAFADLAAGAVSTRPADLEAVVENARERRGPPRPGDLLFFDEEPGVPRVAIVVAQAPRGGVEALACTRGRYRHVRVSPSLPDVRRRDGVILNTFLRPRRAHDGPRPPSLAGELLVGIGTLLD